MKKYILNRRRPGSANSAEPQKPSTWRPNGLMGRKETGPLAALAAKAFARQKSLDGVADETSFDDWRHAEVFLVTGKPGLTKCHHDDFKPLQAHFQALLGDDAGAFKSLMKTGKPTDHAAPGDTHEERRKLAHQVDEVIQTHCFLADTSIEQILEAARQDAEQAGLQFQPSSEAVDRIRCCKQAIEASGKGPIRSGYAVTLVRQRFRKPGFNVTQDLKADLAEHLTATQLEQLLFTVINRIAAREGRGDASTRNRKQRRR